MIEKIKILDNGKILKTQESIHKVSWISFPFAKYTPSLIKIRSNGKGKLDKKDSECFICKEPFLINDDIGLIGMKHHTNILTCQDCAEKVSNKTEIEMFTPNYDTH